MTQAEWQSIIDLCQRLYANDFLRGLTDWRGVPLSESAKANDIKPIYPQVPTIYDWYLRQGNEPPEPEPTPEPVPEPTMTNNLDLQEGWIDLDASAQEPNRWKLERVPNGQPNLWPTKMQEGQVVSSIANRQIEGVFKVISQIPPNEQVGQARAIILSGKQVYKIFHGSSSWKLSQVLPGYTPNSLVSVNTLALIDCADIARGKSGQLEDDHCRFALIANGVRDERIWKDMKDRRDVQGNERPWNKFSVNAPIGSDGNLSIALQGQQNWPDDPTGVAFFLSPIVLSVVVTPPEPTPEPTTDITVSAADALAILNAVNGLQALLTKTLKK